MEISLNWVAIIVVTVALFAGGALWHGPIFGKYWMRIHGSDKLSKEEMIKLTEGMWKILLTEFITLLITVMTLEFMIQILPDYTGMHIAFMVWLGFVFPTIISATIWGNDPKKWMVPKILISGIYRLISLLAAGYILGIW